MKVNHVFIIKVKKKKSSFTLSTDERWNLNKKCKKLKCTGGTNVLKKQFIN